jgi:hypothetical protein
MSEEEKSYIVKPRDLAEIIRTEDSVALNEFMKDPLSVIAGALIDRLSHGPLALTGPMVRIGVSVLKGRAVQQFAKEISYLKEKGKIADNFAERKYGYETWVELLRIMDEESPDDDRLEALKAMFFAANKVNVQDGEQILAYQLFQITKRLNSNELLVMKTVYGMFLKSAQFRSNSFAEWAQAVARGLGHSVVALVELADKALVDSLLLSPRQMSDQSMISSANSRLTDLGLQFCQNIERYQIEKKKS